MNALYTQHASKTEPVWIKEQDWTQAKEELLDNKTLHLAFFGDSVTLQAVHAKSIPHSYNFALAGEDYVQTYYRYTALQNQTKLNTVILQLSRHSFSKEYQVPQKRFKGLFYYRTIVPEEKLHLLTEKSKAQLAIEQQVPSIGKGRTFLQYALNQKMKFTLGWRNNTADLSQYGTDAIRQELLETFFPKENYIQDSTTQVYFLELIKTIQEQNQTIIVLIYPLEKEFAHLLDQKNITKERTIQPIIKQLSTLDTNIVVLDYENLFFDWPEYFSDPGHLNYQGALIFSKQLAEDIH